MRKHIQQCAYPFGDCVRTTMACLLDVDNLDDVPNFMRDGEGKFDEYFNHWLKINNLDYIEIDLKTFETSPSIPFGFCSLVGKSPGNDYDHMVVGEIVKEGKNGRALYFYHNPACEYSNTFIEGDIKWIGFLIRKL